MGVVKNINDHNANSETFLFKSGTGQAEIDQHIWKSFKDGNRKALDYIFEKYVRVLFSYGSRITKDQNLVEDCIQDIFVELWKRRSALSDTDNIKFYLFKSLRRNIGRRSLSDRRHTINILQSYREEVFEYSIESSIIQEQTSLDQKNHLNLAISKLTKRQQEAIYLKFHELLSYEQLAVVLEIDVKSAYKLIGKAIDSLRSTVKIL
jgi:RNA polymerase sigma factor (sigma-70 family)